MHMVHTDIGKRLLRSHYHLIRWLLGTLLTWFVLLGAGAPIAMAQTSQSPDAAPITSDPADTAVVNQTANPTPSQALLSPALIAGVTQAANDMRGIAGGELLALVAAGVMAAAGTQLARGGMASASFPTQLSLHPTPPITVRSTGKRPSSATIVSDVGIVNAFGEAVPSLSVHTAAAAQSATLAQTVMTPTQQLQAAPAPLPADRYLADLRNALDQLRQQPTPNTELIGQLEAKLANAQTLLTGTVDPIKGVLIVDETGQVVPLSLYLKTLPNGKYQLIDLTNPLPDAVGVYEGDTIEATWQEFLANNYLPAGQLAAAPPPTAGSQPGVWRAHTHEQRSWRRRISDWLWEKHQWPWYRDLLEGWRQSGWFGKAAAGVLGFVVNLLTSIDPQGNYQRGWSIITVVASLVAAGFGLLGKLTASVGAWFKNLPFIKWLGNTKFVKWLAESRLVKWLKNPDNIASFLKESWSSFWELLASVSDDLIKRFPFLGRIIDKAKAWIKTWLKPESGGIGSLSAKLRAWRERISQLPVIRPTLEFLKNIRSMGQHRFVRRLTKWLNDLSQLPVIRPTLEFLKNIRQGFIDFIKKPANRRKAILDLLTYIGSNGLVGAFIWFFKSLLKDILQVKWIKRLFMFTGAVYFAKWVAEWLGWATPPPTAAPPQSEPQPSPQTPRPAPPPTAPSPAPTAPQPSAPGPQPTTSQPSSSPPPAQPAPQQTPPAQPAPQQTPPTHLHRQWSMVRKGDSNENVVTLQAMLRRRGYNVPDNGKFDAKTRAAVIRFQRNRGRAVDGIVGPDTWTALVPTLRLGDRNLVVKALQRQLVHKYGYPIAIDGRFGSIETRPAVIAFQRAHGLAPDGIVGPNTWAALLSGVSASGAQHGDNRSSKGGSYRVIGP